MVGMCTRDLIGFGVIVAAVSLSVATGGAQSPAPRAALAAALAKPSAPARTPWGHPDLQGTCTSTDENGVPLERPDAMPAQQGLTDAEFGYRGVSRGRWEGNVLVVETTNFTERTQIGVNGNGNAHGRHPERTVT
jgi:hypothetical protein